ncbi:MAG: bifunctional molybdenum cofactor biosynthesis protein MoaC/MoaB [Oligoflexia bacterium]|nr:bifunctional molybdenum cofactor biosynthesis protein MoaC/MoaB [Oligoflexia bacterium]
MTNSFRMINVGEKFATKRRAVATGSIRLAGQTMDLIRSRTSPKGDILAIAEVAGIMAAKNTSQLLPLCHPLFIDSVKIWFEVKESHVDCFCEVFCEGKTGVEMEALVGVNIALLTIYDLAKAVDPVIEIGSIYLQTKQGGKSGLWEHPNLQSARSNLLHKSLLLTDLRFAVGTLSDRASSGVYEDRSGIILREFCLSNGAAEEFYTVIPDEKDRIADLISTACKSKVDVLLLTGGTGISERDIAPEVLAELASKAIVGFGERQRQYGAQFTDASWLSRSSAYVVSNTLVVLFPGSPRAVQQGLECVGSLIPHAVAMIRGESH